MCGRAGASTAGVARGQHSGRGRGAGGAREADQGNGQAPIHRGVHVYARAIHAHLSHSSLAAQVLANACFRLAVAAAVLPLSPIFCVDWLTCWYVEGCEKATV